MFLFCSCGSIELQLSLTCAHAILINFRGLKLTPHHLIHDAHIALDDLHYLGRDILIHIIRNWYSMLSVLAELNSSIYCLKEALLVNAGNDEVALVDGFGTFGRCADADGRERMANTGEE